jgi:predicted PurR-regulated permease PerM
MSTGSPPTSPVALWPGRSIVAGTLVVLGVVASFCFAYLFRYVLFCLLIGIVIDTAVTPLVNRMTTTLGMARGTTVVLIYLTASLLVAAVLAFGVPLLVEQIMTLIDALPSSYAEIRQQLLNAPVEAIRRMASRMQETIPPLDLESLASVLRNQGLGSTVGNAAAGALFWTGAVLLLAFNWSLQRQRTIGSLLLFVPDAKRDAARAFVEQCQDRVGAFVRGQGVLCLAVGGLSLIGYVLIGLPNALALAALAGVLEIVPYFGPILGTVPALIMAVSGDPSQIIWVLAVAAVVQVLENNLLVPKIMDASVGVHPVVTLLAIVAFSAAFGTAGMILAIPLAAILQVIMEHFLLRPEVNEPPAPAGRDRISRVRYEVGELMKDVRQQVRTKREAPTDDADQVEDSIESIAAEIERQLSDTADANAAESAATDATAGAEANAAPRANTAADANADESAATAARGAR